MSIKEFLKGIKKDSDIGRAFVHEEIISEKEPVFDEITSPIPVRLKNTLPKIGIKSFYSHQAQAIDLIARGVNVVVATETASGKSLTYNVPVLKSILENPNATSLYLFPLKALEQDQLKAFEEMLEALNLEKDKVGIYDGDTPQHKREKIKKSPPNVLITNPDMIHLSFLPYYKNWAKFFKNLKFIVIDELHTYKGVFGSHISQIMRRLWRVLDFYGCRPQIIGCSATISNPSEFSEKLLSVPFDVVTESGAPRGKRHFVFISHHEFSTYLLSSVIFRKAVKEGLKTIAFTKSRKITELLHTWLIDADKKLKDRISSYRAGFLPEERRTIEKKLFSGELDGVISTSALEMGIDIGELDVCILVGYPGTIIDTWQRGGRVGRTTKDSVVFMVAQQDALDQYFIKHPRDFFTRNYEAAVVDPENETIKKAHMVCAAAEMPLKHDDRYFSYDNSIKQYEDLENEGELLRSAEGKEFFSNRKKPQRFVNIREAGDSYTIFQVETKNVIGSVGGSKVYSECHEGAIYLHRSKQFVVRKLDLEKKNVYAQPCDVKYYTQAKSEKETEILEVLKSKPVCNFVVRLGKLKVTTQVVGYDKRRIFSQDLLSSHPLDLPKTTFETVGFWIEVDNIIRDYLKKKDHDFMGGIHALEHAMISLFPLFALSDRDDVGGICYPAHPQTGKAAIFVYDGYPGGVGLAKRGFEVIEDLLKSTETMINDCDCDEGCPSCIHSPKCGSGNKPLDKYATKILLQSLLRELPSDADTKMDDSVFTDEELEISMPKPKPESKTRIITFDIETQRSAAEVGGWQNSHLMRVACIVAYDSLDERYIAYHEEDVDEFLKLIQEADLVVGFNNERFDYKVLRGYTDYDFSRLKSLDILKEVYSRIKFRLSLDHLAKETLKKGKEADGLQSLKWFKEGRLDLVINYCKSDVEITWELFEFGIKNKFLLFKRKDGNSVRIPVDWELEKLI